MDARTRSYLDRAAEAVAKGRYEESAGYERIAADRVHSLGDPPEELAALLDAGARRQLARGDAGMAADTLQSLVALRRQLGDQPGEEEAMRRLSEAQWRAGQHSGVRYGQVTRAAAGARPDPTPPAPPSEPEP